MTVTGECIFPVSVRAGEVTGDSKVLLSREQPRSQSTTGDNPSCSLHDNPLMMASRFCVLPANHLIGGLWGWAETSGLQSRCYCMPFVRAPVEPLECNVVFVFVCCVFNLYLFTHLRRRLQNGSCFTVFVPVRRS